MKRSPQADKLDETLRSSSLSAGGFLGADKRPLEEIINADLAELARLDRTVEQLVERMRSVMATAEAGLGTTVSVSDKLEARTTEARGIIACPWPHPGRHPKTAVLVARTDTGEAAQWSALNIHMIEEHGFFEGKGSPFRLEPRKLVEMLFEPEQ